MKYIKKFESMELFKSIDEEDFDNASDSFVPVKQSLFHKFEDLVDPRKFHLFYKDNEDETGDNSSHIGLVNLKQSPYYDRIWIFEDDDHYFWIKIYNVMHTEVYSDRYYKCDSEEGLIQFIKSEGGLVYPNSKEELEKLRASKRK